MAEIDKVISVYGDKLVFLLMGGFLVAKTIEKVNLHKRFALNTLKVVGTKPKNIVFGFIIVTGCLSAWITNTATTLLILPIAIAVISQVDVAQKKTVCNLSNSLSCICCKSWWNGYVNWHCT